MTVSSTLAWSPALDSPGLLAEGVHTALAAWAAQDADVAEQVVVCAIDPTLSDTAALTAAYGLEQGECGNCVLVAGKRDGQERLASALVPADTRADVNSAVKRLLNVRKASFLTMERAVADSGMEYGAITPLGLPDAYRVLVDTAVSGRRVVIGSGLRASKLALPGELLLRWPRAEAIDGLGLRAA